MREHGGTAFDALGSAEAPPSCDKALHILCCMLPSVFEVNVQLLKAVPCCALLLLTASPGTALEPVKIVRSPVICSDLSALGLRDSWAKLHDHGMAAMIYHARTLCAELLKFGVYREFTVLQARSPSIRTLV